MQLVQSGRYLREQQAGTGSNRNQYTIKRAIPAALDRFQDSLDELESELHQAQAVLRRDLAQLQADRRKREEAEAAERQRLAASSKNAPPIKKEETPPKPAETAPEPQELVKEPETAKVEEQPATLERATEPPPPISTSAPPPTENNENTERDPLFDGTPTTANAPDNDFDFDAMFNDIGDAGADQNTGDNNAQDIDMGGTQDLTFDLSDSGPSLLRGLEDFANSKTGDDGTAAQASTSLDLDFAMPDLPDLSMDPPPDVPKPVEQQQEPSHQDTNNNDTDMLEPMTTDDLDDLFNMDYENPETTEFDNAFIGFD